MKERIRNIGKEKNMKKNKRDYVAILTITEVPRTKESQAAMVRWLRDTAIEIKNSDPDIFAEPCRIKLMK